MLEVDLHRAEIAAVATRRGLMEPIVINVGYDLGIIPRSVFTVALVSSVVTPSARKRWLGFRALERSERERVA